MKWWLLLCRWDTSVLGPALLMQSCFLTVVSESPTNWPSCILGFVRSGSRRNSVPTSAAVFCFQSEALFFFFFLSSSSCCSRVGVRACPSLWAERVVAWESEEVCERRRLGFVIILGAVRWHHPARGSAEWKSTGLFRAVQVWEEEWSNQTLIVSISCKTPLSTSSTSSYAQAVPTWLPDGPQGPWARRRKKSVLQQ